MDFLNKLGKKASEAYHATKEKASDISEEIKLKSKVNSLEEKVYELYAEISSHLIVISSFDTSFPALTSWYTISPISE